MSQTTHRIDGVDQYRVIEPMFEAIRIALTHKGEGYAPHYIQGLSGAAFRVAGICPCAPTCSCGTSPQKLAADLGYEACRISPMEEANLPKGNADGEFVKLMAGEDLPEAAKLEKEEYRRIHAAAVRMNERIKGALLAGEPVVVWHAFTWAENDVVCGYDDSTGQWLGRGSYAGASGEYAKAKQYRCMKSQEVGGWPSALILGRRVRQPGLRELEIAALKEAVRHGLDATNAGQPVEAGWKMLNGIACYRRWAEEFTREGKKRGSGDAYCFGVYRTTHACAAPFLREIAPRHPGMQTQLLQAADAFEREAALVATGDKLLSWGSPEGPDMARDAAAHDLLSRAADLYAEGIGHLEKALS